MTALMWHPVTGAIFEAHDDAVAIHRQSGWLLATEREEHEARIAERETAAAKDSTKDSTSKKGM